MGGKSIDPGPVSVAGLSWLARVGPAPTQAWGVAMGWGRTARFDHAARLVTAGWVDSAPMRRGEGSLWWASREGLAVTGIEAAAMKAPPAPTTWGHCVATAWTAAWLTARGREMWGSRELLADDRWKGDLEWMERDGLRRRGHRPDLVGAAAGSEAVIAVEVELAAKSNARLRSVLALHAAWIAAGKTQAVLYVCGGPISARRVVQVGGEVGLDQTVGPKRLRVELLKAIQEQAITASAAAAEAHA